MTDENSDLQLEARYRRYLDMLANTPIPAKADAVAAVARHAAPAPRARRMAVAAVVVALAVAGSVATVALTHQRTAAPTARRTTVTAAEPTPCPAGSEPTPMPTDLSDAQFNQAIQNYDRWDRACEAAWWANLDLSGVDWATVPHKEQVAASSYAAPEFASLATAVGAADTVLVGTVASIGKADGIVFNLTIQRVLKGPDVGTRIAMVDEGVVEPLDGPVPTGLAIVDGLGDAFPIPGQRVIVLGTLTSSGLQPELYSGIYLVNSEGRVTALPASPFASTITGTTETSFIAAIESVMSSG